MNKSCYVWLPVLSRLKIFHCDKLLVLSLYFNRAGLVLENLERVFP